MNPFKTIPQLTCIALMMSSTGCASRLPPITPVPHVDLPRFMGDWYVIATIPTRFEKTAYNALETYTLEPDGDVATVFHFRDGSFESPVKSIHSTGLVKPDSGNAVWGVQLFWPIKAQYIVAWLDEDYSQTIIARDARDYAWIMARTPFISQADYTTLLAKVEALGYPMDRIRKVPHSWPASDS